MNPDQVTELVRAVLKEALLLSAPILLIATGVSLIISLLLTLTSLQDQTLSTVPRLIAVAIALVVAAPWMVRRMATFSIGLLGNFHRFTQ